MDHSRVNGSNKILLSNRNDENWPRNELIQQSPQPSLFQLGNYNPISTTDKPNQLSGLPFVRNWKKQSLPETYSNEKTVKKPRITAGLQPTWSHRITEDSSSTGSIGYMKEEFTDVIDANIENSQTMLQNLSLTQTTQPNTQLSEEEAHECFMRLSIHPDVQKSLSEKEKLDLIGKNLYNIEITDKVNSVMLGREVFNEIFKVEVNGVFTNKLSRCHCQIVLNQDHTVSVIDHSTNGTKVNGRLLGKGKSEKLKDGQTLCILTTATGKMVLGYKVEKPFTVDSKLPPISPHENQHVPFQQNTLGVLFAAPLVGKDLKGECHAMDALDLQKEYIILVESLRQANTMATRNSPEYAYNESSEILVPQQVNVSFKFATTDTFRQMLTVGCRSLHFSGHGNETHLYFEDGFAGVHPVPHESLKKLFAAGGTSNVRLAFVSACSSAAVASAFLTSGVPHVVAVKLTQKIEDQAAIVFTKAFYLAIASGRSVSASFNIAQQAVANSAQVKLSSQAAEKFQLLPDNADHDEVVFPQVKMTWVEYETRVLKSNQRRFPVLCPDHIPAVCQGFAERTVEVYKLCVEIMHRNDARVSTICGPEGIGKTSVACAVAKYISERRVFEGGVRVFSIHRMISDQKLKTTAPEGNDDALSHISNEIENHKKKNSSSSAYSVDQPVSMLIILDGCDHYLDESRAIRFRQWISNILTDNPSIKILTTNRIPIAVSGTIAGFGERTFGLKNFNFEASARLLLNLSPRPIFYAELKKVHDYSRLDLTTCVSKHPALHETGGNPKRIAELAIKLNEKQMDNLCP